MKGHKKKFFCACEECEYIPFFFYYFDHNLVGFKGLAGSNERSTGPKDRGSHCVVATVVRKYYFFLSFIELVESQLLLVCQEKLS